MTTRSLMTSFFAALAAVTLLALLAAGAGRAQDPGPRLDGDLRDALARSRGDAEMRVILTYDRVPTTAQADAVEALGLDVHRFDVLPMLAARGTSAEVGDLLSLSGPVKVYKDERLDYLLHESVKRIGADRVRAGLGITGRGVGVAVIDSGVDGLNRDVRYPGRLVQNAKIVGDNLFTNETVVLENQKNTDTSSGHGTHVAGTIGGGGANSDGYYRGVAPRADLVGIGAGEAISILYALEGFDYALQNQKKYDIRVISNSWGTTGAFDPEDPVNRASRVAHDRGISVVFAAGNEGPGKNTLNPYSVAPWTIGVAAGKKDGRSLAGFSSRGVPGSDRYHPDITAPGVNIVSARASTGATINGLAAADDATYIPARYRPYYTTSSGTSMATPHVAGTVALMEQADGSLGPDAIERILTETADPMPRYARWQAGAGYLDAYKAVSRARR